RDASERTDPGRACTEVNRSVPGAFPMFQLVTQDFLIRCAVAAVVIPGIALLIYLLPSLRDYVARNLAALSALLINLTIFYCVPQVPSICTPPPPGHPPRGFTTF